jgi:hypothetical protein
METMKPAELETESPLACAGTDAKSTETGDAPALEHGYTLDDLQLVAMHPEQWARLHGRVPDRVTREPVAFLPSSLQARMFRHYAFCQGRGAPCRLVVPKTRRGGGSTGAAALLYVHAHNYRARLGAVGTDEAVSLNMFEMMRFFDRHEDFPGWDRASKILESGWLEWPSGSSWERYTAENPEAARSAGLQGYHGTEVGRWYDGGAKDARETLKSMLGAVPRRGFTVAIEESTAQGAQGAFYERFLAARWPTAEELGVPVGEEYWLQWADETPQNTAATEAERTLQFVRVFAAWFEDEENCAAEPLEEEDRRRLEATLDVQEQALLARYRKTGPQGERLGEMVFRARLWEQLAWRRAVIATEFDGNAEAFAQENPASPQEAFVSSGRHSFNRAGCAWLIEQARSRVPEIGVLERQSSGGVVFRRTGANEAWCHVWVEPREGHSYLAALDTCGGRSHVRNPEAGDFHAGLVLRAGYVDDHGQRQPHAVVAALLPCCQFDPDVLADKMHLLSDYYGGCLVVFEVNNTGAAFRQEAVRLAMNLYCEEQTDKFTSVVTKYLGWTTTKETRAQLIGTLKKHLRCNATSETRPDGVVCWSPVVAQECADMTRDLDGTDRAPGSKHDDHVMALGMALQCVSGATYLAPKRRRRREPADRGKWQRHTP